jgi:hypothetical protein
MLDSLFLSVDNISLERWIEITWVSEDLEVTTDSFLSFVLSFSLDIDRLMLGIKMSENFVQEFKKL